MRYKVERGNGITTIIIEDEKVFVQALSVDPHIEHLIVTSGNQAVKNAQLTYYPPISNQNTSEEKK